ncbi:hypothetical protein VF21_10134 [Pseudogymnoascus sp. 05NY08]|nr:hypothetical protein VF21_10134 [Pseudogymnoascus sp. 05NY08]OBT83161.1 hypothetical protein VE02_08236 [Pseudogymnoascus sp. 03VT05]
MDTSHAALSTMATPPHRRIVGVSLKMYFTPAETLSYITAIAHLAATNPSLDIFIIPDFLSLGSAQRILGAHGPSLQLGAQDCFWEDSGAYTGEVSPASLSAMGCTLVELGHAERRRLFGESDELVARKAQAAERNGLLPLVCIGERERGSLAEAVDECVVQMEAVLAVTAGDLVFAYEPVWAIGLAQPAAPEHVVAVTKALRRTCPGREGRVRFLYGGSAGPGTFAGMSDGVDGLFLGRFVHDVGNLETVIREVAGS